ncbi:MAG: fimbrial protein [Kluyvera sp.]|uniref:fimbrial protein n=1 Tax=Kluyvera sp. TaxID=1538228 RepID=UPI003F2AB21B
MSIINQSVKKMAIAMVLTSGLPLLSANAAQTAVAMLNITVTVTLPTCSLTVPASIDMGVVSNQDFSGVGTTAKSKNFNLELIGCNGNVDGATITFSGKAADNDTSSFAVDTGNKPAKGVGLQIKDALGAILSPNKSSATYMLATSSPDITLPFEASFIQTEDLIEAGTAGTTVTVSIVYS